MKKISRRNVLKLAAASGVLMTAGKHMVGNALAGSVELAQGGRDFNPETGKERKAVPTVCFSCVTRDPKIAFVEDGRCVKIEGQPNSIRSLGKICAKGQAGVNQIYFPDRILYPLKRVGKRGDGKYKRITWDEALTDLATRMKKLRDDGHPEKFMYHYGRAKGSSSKLPKTVFMGTYGSKTISGHTSICEGGKWVAQELTWGNHYDNWDFDNTDYVLNFGSSVLEAHTNHIPLAQRLIKAKVERNVPLITFDVRLSYTAAKSTKWEPVRPGTDLAVLLAMNNVIMQENLYDRDAFTFIRATEDVNAPTDEKIADLKKHLAEYTPEWAEKISGVSAANIKKYAREFAKAKAACVISYRGLVAHYNGTDGERAAQMLAMITGNINNRGGRCKAVAPHWKYPKGPKNKPKAKKLKITNGTKSALPNHGECQSVLKMIKDGSHGRPDIYFWYCYNPVYVNGNCQENIDVLSDEKMMPFTVTSNILYDESSRLADLILPDTSYLERWDWDGNVGPTQQTEYELRQPVVEPLGECRNFSDILCDLAKRMDMPLGFDTMEEFVRKSCEMTPVIKDLPGGGFEYMKKHGVYHDPNEKPHFDTHKKVVKDADLKKEGVILDEALGVYWNWKKSKAKDEAAAKAEGYAKTHYSYKGYVGQKIGDKVYKGFKPDKVNKTGYFELYSTILKEKGFAPFPSWKAIPEHEGLAENQLTMTTYKVPVQIHSRSTQCKWLTEMFHDNPAWINSKTAASLGIKDGDMVKLTSKIGEISIKAYVNEMIVPGSIAISFHLGRTESGRYASGKKSIMGTDNDPDLKLKWWDTYGVHPNWLLANDPDPISGQERFMDEVVTISKA
jgi:anaerobic selenocysteine-containing dehydrogenase